jgi:hypothetical protein
MESIGNKTATAVPRAAPPAAVQKGSILSYEGGKKTTTAVPRAAPPAAVMQ